MALSNIFREPKRELIEQWYGFVAFVVFAVGLVICDLAIVALNMEIGWVRPFWDWKDIEAGQIFAIPGLFIVAFFVYLIHDLGEAVCNGMQARGRDPRPKNRPRG